MARPFWIDHKNTWHGWVENRTTSYSECEVYRPVYATGSGITIWPAWVSERKVPTMTGCTMVNSEAGIEAWDGWNRVAFRPSIPTYGRPAAFPLPNDRPLTREQAFERARHNLIIRNRGRANELRQKLAKRRARELLLEHLDEVQREEYEKGRSFTVVTADGLRTYRIAFGTAGNVRLIATDGGARSKYGSILKPGARFCMHVYHPEGRIPDEDNMLAQKLLLESEGGEREFLAAANVG